MKTIYFVTGNENKFREVKEILADRFDVQNIKLDLLEKQELDVEKIAYFKAKEAFKQTSKPVLVEDTGLTIEEWNGLPGALIKWFVKTVGTGGIVKLVDGFKSRRATAKTTFAYADQNGTMIFSGEVKGRIAKEPRGETNFGWDPIFIPDGYSKTFAEMAPEEKNKISHRKLALDKVAHFIPTT